MIVAQLTTGAIYVFPDHPPHAGNPAHALAGPFPTGDDARRWILTQGEAKLSPELLAQYDTLKQAAGGDAADVGHLLALLMLVARRRDAAFLTVSSGPIVEDPTPLSRRLTSTVHREREPGED